MICLFFFFNDTATTEIYTLSLHDALPICFVAFRQNYQAYVMPLMPGGQEVAVDTKGGPLPVTRVSDVGADYIHWSRNGGQDRKSTRLNSSHANISYAVFCLKKKKH